MSVHMGESFLFSQEMVKEVESRIRRDKIQMKINETTNQIIGEGYQQRARKA